MPISPRTDQIGVRRVDGQAFCQPPGSWNVPMIRSIETFSR